LSAPNFHYSPTESKEVGRSTTPSAIESTDLIAVAVRSIHTMADGTRADFDPLYNPGAIDRENRVQPPSSRVPGAAGFYSTAMWLRAAFAGLHYDMHHAVGEGDIVVVNSTMNGRHVAAWVVYTDDARVDSVFPPTGRSFAMTQSHWFRFVGDRIVEHWANRDDLGMARQLGWVPPTPAFLIRMALAKNRAKRACRDSRSPFR
jgi:predicted ester cyclase